MSECGRYIISRLEDKQKHLLKGIRIYEIDAGNSVNLRFTKDSMDLIWLNHEIFETVKEMAALFNKHLEAVLVWSYPEFPGLKQDPKVELELMITRGPA